VSPGTGRLFRFVWRRDRRRLALWIGVAAFLYWVQAIGIDIAYPTQADLDALAASMEGNTALLAMAGPPYALNTVGGQVAFQMSAFGAVLAALMSMFTVGRHTRAEEESGRDELIRAGVVGHHAPLLATALATVTANVLLGLAIALSLIAYGLPVAGSAALGVAAGGTGLVFTGVALLAAQLADSTRVLYATVGTAIAAAYALRAVGDAGDSWVSWLSPIGWGQAMRAYAGEAWWPVALMIPCAVALGALAVVVSARRDVGAGVFATRPGPPRAGRLLRSGGGIAWNLQRWLLVGWATGLLAMGLAYGSMGNDLESLIGDLDVNDLLGTGARDLVDAFYAMCIALQGLLASAYGIAAVLRVRAEEREGRLELLLATALSRPRLLASHAVIAAAGSLVVVGLGGVGLAAMYAAVSGDVGGAPRLAAASLAYAPALWVMAALTLLILAVRPGLAGAPWAVLGFSVFALMFGETLRLPDWLVDLSPFAHVPLVPAEDYAWTSALGLTAVAAALTAAAFAAFRRRDVASA